jgi:hypothetical protein
MLYQHTGHYEQKCTCLCLPDTFAIHLLYDAVQVKINICARKITQKDDILSVLTYCTTCVRQHRKTAATFLLLYVKF